jgi:valyl-tRNA synthetase
MSKSKGNVLDPLDLIDGIELDALIAKRTEALMNPAQRPAIEAATRSEFPQGIPAFGTDALRMTFTSLATMGREIRFDLGRIEGYQKFCNKLWNASQYVFAQIGDYRPGNETEPGTADRWIRSRLHRCIVQTRASIESYRFDLATQALYEFTWHEFCDWYLELTKPVLTGDQVPAARKRAAQETLATVLNALLRLLHPIAPFVTEELWLSLGDRLGLSSETLMLEAFPAAGDFAEDPEANAEIDWLKGFIVGIRQIRGEMNLSPGRPLPVRLQGYSDEDRARVERNGAYIERLGRVEKIDWLAPDDIPPGVATALLGEMRILIPLAGLIDVALEVERVEKQLGRLGKDEAQTRGKLANERFVRNAPEDVVRKEHERAAEFALRRHQLESQLATLREID